VKYCIAPGCLQLAHSGRCSRHQIARPKGAQWNAVRRAVLARDPICTICHKAPSTEVDHVVPLSAGGWAWDQRNLRGTCRRCNRRAGIEDRRGA
jgi:5-methylcytosine-specific restriction endonuclease McrA